MKAWFPAESTEALCRPWITLSTSRSCSRRQYDFRHRRELVIERISRRGPLIIENLMSARVENKIEARRTFGTSSTIFSYCSYSHHAGPRRYSVQEHSKLFPPSTCSKMSPVTFPVYLHSPILFPPKTRKLRRQRPKKFSSTLDVLFPRSIDR